MAKSNQEPQAHKFPWPCPPPPQKESSCTAPFGALANLSGLYPHLSWRVFRRPAATRTTTPGGRLFTIFTTSPLFGIEIRKPLFGQQWRGVISPGRCHSCCGCGVGKGVSRGADKLCQKRNSYHPPALQECYAVEVVQLFWEILYKRLQNVVCIKTVEDFVPLICYLRSNYKNFSLWRKVNYWATFTKSKGI